MEHKEAGCQTPEGPILCINNCGFFGSATTMNMCSKCHKEMALKQEQAKLAASSIDSIVNGSGSKSEREPVTAKDVAADTVQSKAISLAEPSAIDVSADTVQLKTISREPLEGLVSNASDEAKAAVEVETKVKAGPSRCGACKKRVSLMGFNCRCGGVFCASHRYSEKHECSFDYRATGRDEIAKSNPVVKAEKLEKI